MDKFNYELIKKLRKKNKMSQIELSSKLGISNRAVSKWENGLSEPTAQHIFGLSRIFNIPMNHFYGEQATGTIKKTIEGMGSIKEIYKIGRGPSSSHTIGPEKACMIFKERNSDADFFKAILYGSLAKTGKGHGTNTIIEKTLAPTPCEVEFCFADEDIPHPNTLVLIAYKNKSELERTRVFSIGGGNILFEMDQEKPADIIYKETKFKEIADHCKSKKIRLWEYVKENEPEDFIKGLKEAWETMKTSIEEGIETEGILPGGLKLQRKAKTLYNSQHIDESAGTKENRIVCAYAFAVSEQNASGETIVTAPTCGAAGVLPAVLYYQQQKNGYSDDQIIHALMTAGLIGNLIKTNASISGAECGCQAEIGSACAMAAAALSELFELSIDKIEYAAEIAIEHHLGLTCDPICGLVQIPCIERNAVAAMRAINAVSLASLLWSTRKISLDNVIQTMKETGYDLKSTYKETSEAGLAKIDLERDVIK
ncbi:MAG: L-serine ammonia-lyase [Firmicutes bacterium]|nr:L-serine ammonia-lyase [Bacillota bacterium]MBR6799412.1 L-serine ammonia-lyase [Bacillota bacterium]